jgi:hypothetical protein
MPEPFDVPRHDGHPLLADYLTGSEMDRLAGVLAGLLVSANRARIERAARMEGAPDEDPG